MQDRVHLLPRHFYLCTSSPRHLLPRHLYLCTSSRRHRDTVRDVIQMCRSSSTLTSLNLLVCHVAPAISGSPFLDERQTRRCCSSIRRKSGRKLFTRVAHLKLTSKLLLLSLQNKNGSRVSMFITQLFSCISIRVNKCFLINH